MASDSERKGALGDHERRGRKYIPSMASLLTVREELREDAPDFVWPAMVGVLGGDSLFSAFVDVQRAALEAEPGRGDTARFDGRLSTLEQWSSDSRAKHIDALVAAIDSGGLMPDAVLAVFRLYRDLPGSWLLVEPWKDRDTSDSVEDGLVLLASAVTEWGKGDHVNALTKYLTFCWAALAGGMTWDKSFTEFLSDFPTNTAKRGRAASIIRAGYSALRGAQETRNGDPSLEIATRWAMSFWNTNWKLTDCILPQSGSESEDGGLPEDASTAADDAQHEDEDEKVKSFAERASAQYERLIDAYFGHSARDLMNPLADEVVAGLTLRAITGVISLIRAPHQWSSQFAASTLRQLAEIEIMLTWFQAHPEDFEKYRDFGLGHEKLAWLHVEDMLSGLEELPADLVPVSEKLEDRRRVGPVLDVTVVSTASSFNGLTMRAMAKEVGLDLLYRTVFQVSSSEVHGEWEPVRRENLQQCLNPLHRWHLVPSTEPPWIHDPMMPRIVLRTLERVVDLGLEMLGGEAAS